MTLLAAIRRKTRLLARVGCVSIGTVYILIGAVALLALSGRMIEMADEDRIIPLLMSVPGGAVLVWGIIAGTAGSREWTPTACRPTPRSRRRRERPTRTTRW